MEEASKWRYTYWHNGDVDFSNLTKLANVSGAPDAIYHLAGGSSVASSLKNPYEDFGRTVETTAQLLEWVRLYAARSNVVCVSSAAVYGSSHTGKIPEETPVSPHSPYGSHKAIMESMCHSYANNFGLQICIVRLFSVYGAELQKQLIWDMCCKLVAAGSASVALDGTGNEVRDWLHVSDAASLLWLVKNECGTQCAVINGGTGIGTTVSDIAKFVRRAWPASVNIEFSNKTRKGDPPSLIADIEKAKRLGFRPAVSIEEGIDEVVGWFKQQRGGPLHA